MMFSSQGTALPPWAQIRSLTVALLITAPCLLALAAPDLAHDIAKCSVDKNSVSRLACYDALAPTATAQDPARSASSVSKWHVQTETSKIDDSKNVIIALDAESEIAGWPSKRVVPELIIRCQERRTEAYIVTGMPPTVEYGGDTATVTFRLDKQPAFKVAASKSTDGNALFLPGAAALAKRFAASETLLFQFIPFNSSGQMTTFDMRGLSAALKPVREACKW